GIFVCGTADGRLPSSPPTVNANAPDGADEEADMTNFRGIRGTALVGVIALAPALAACSDRDAQARAADGEGMVIAHATPEPVPVTPVADAPAPVPVPEPRYVNVTYEEAESAVRKGRYDESVEMFESYVDSNPTNAFGFYMLGLSAWKTGDHDRAEEALVRAVELNGESVKI